jgi:hypothetical protein
MPAPTPKSLTPTSVAVAAIERDRQSAVRNEARLSAVVQAAYIREAIRR